MYEQSSLTGDVVGELGSGDIIVLVRFEEKRGGLPPVGYVLPHHTIDTGLGWIALEDLAGQGQVDSVPVRKCKLPGSWAVKARYAVLSEATVRKDKSLSSPRLGELKPGEEVLVLEVGANGDDVKHKARFRMKVHTDHDLVGWISPENGEHMLLEPIDLLSPKLLELVKSSSGHFLAASPSVEPVVRGSLKRALTAPRHSWMHMTESPWKEGGQYRVLENQKLRETNKPNSKEVCRLQAGALVELLEVNDKNLSECVARALIVGDRQGRSGWIRCSAKDGHDLIDTRDQLQFEKLVAKLELEDQAEREALEAENIRQEQFKRQQEQLKREREAQEQAQAKATKGSCENLVGLLPCFAGCLRSLKKTT